jgi:hypothetical protein
MGDGPLGVSRDQGTLALPSEAAASAAGPGPIPVRVRVVSRTRRAALAGLLLLLGLLVVLSWLGSSIVGLNALADGVDHRVDLAIDAATAAPLTSDVDEIRRAGRVVVGNKAVPGEDGDPVDTALTDIALIDIALIDIARADSPVIALIVEAAERGTTVQRETRIGDRPVTVRAQALSREDGGVPVLVGIITRDLGAEGRLMATLALVHGAALVVVAVLAHVLARRSSRVVEELFLPGGSTDAGRCPRAPQPARAVARRGRRGPRWRHPRGRRTGRGLRAR